MASVDRGQSVQIFPKQRGGKSPAYGAGQPTYTSGVFDSAEPNQTSPNVPGGVNGAPTLDHTHPQRFSTLVMPGHLGGGSPSLHVTYYKMRGWYATGSVYETWTSVNSPNFTPPSGHTLTDIAIVGKIST